MTAYLNGQFLPLEECRVSVLDRGFLFGDGVYELVPVYGGRAFRLDSHLERLMASLAAVQIDNPYAAGRWAEILDELIARAGGGDLTLYLQLTRGVAPRDHAFPTGVPPTVFVMARPLEPLPEAILQAGVTAVALDDIRWSRCDIKAISLLPNVLLRQQAIAQGAAEAILIRDGRANEGAASNLFVVHQGAIITPPKGPGLLPGITRDMVLALLERQELVYREAEIPREMLFEAHEIWLTSSSKEVIPVVELNGQSIGSGRPGPVWSRVYRLLQEYKAGLRQVPATDDT